ncbi:MAG: enoyl-CoA hydratase [Pseudohongiellaceae bacterium]|jgi:enoyl-CoA hydratase
MTVLIEKKGKVMTIIINRPDAKNAVDATTANALADAFGEFEQDDSAYVAVLCGSGNTFCAGWDLKKAANGEGLKEIEQLKSKDDGPIGPTKMLLSKPVIGAISGYAVAGGMELALWCDMRVMEEDAVFGVFCRRFGVPLVDGGTVRLPRLIGMSNAMDLILTGRPVEATEAKAMGLANRVVKQGEARKAAEALAAQIASFPQACLRSDRMGVYEQWDLGFQSALKNEFQRGIAVVSTGETFTGADLFSKGKGRHGEF